MTSAVNTQAQTTPQTSAPQNQLLQGLCYFSRIGQWWQILDTQHTLCKKQKTKTKKTTCDSSVTQRRGCLLEAVHQLLHCALRWKDCDITLSKLNILREGPCAWTTDAPIALCEPLHIALTRGATIPWSSHPGEGRCSIHKRRNIAFKSSVFFLKKRKGGIEQKMSYQGKKNIPKITVSKELFLLHWLQELWWLLLQITAEGFSVFLRRCDGSLSHTPMQAQSNMKMLFLLSEPTAGSRWNNARNDMACLATIVTVRQGDKAFS